MVTQKRISAVTVAALFTIGLALNFSGCSKEMAPLGLEQTKQESISQTNLQKIVTVNDGKVKLLTFTSNQPSLKKLVTNSTLIKPYEGGILTMEITDLVYTSFDDSDKDKYFVSKKLKAKTTLELAPKAVENSVKISVTMDDQLSILGDFDMEFSPHGLVFNTPAILNIEAYNLDLSDLNTDIGTLGIYYDNQETGQWEKMECDGIKIDISSGTIKVVNAKLPHFSRYAVGGE